MGGTVQYKTRQREELLSFLKSSNGKHFTINDLNAYFQRRKIPIGQTTLYRQLERMVEEGLVNKYYIENTSSACFGYAGDKDFCQQPVCFHCKCEKCGKLIHLKCEELEQIQKHLLEEHGFELNPTRMVFYGICKECQKAQKE